MPDPFDSAHLKLDWAWEHIYKLEEAIADFLQVCPGESFTEPHPDKPEHKVHKVRLARPLPNPLSLIAGDAVDNLRAVLDHALYAISIPRKDSHPREAHFPFAGSAARLENQIKGRCADVPKDIYPLLRGLQPYKGGNALLVTLNEACNRNKHALLLSCVPSVHMLRAALSATGGAAGVPLRHVWDRSKKEMELFTIGPGADCQAQFDLRFLVILSDIGAPEDEQASAVLRAVAQEVERVLLAIEGEARRLGFC